MVPEAAPIVTVPAAEPLANPPPLIDATLESDELHTTVPLMSFVVPSERWAMATNCCVLPMPIDMDDGVTCSDDTVGFAPDEDDDDCELFPEAPPPQPQLSDAKIKSAMHVIFFITFSRFAIHGYPGSSGRILIRPATGSQTVASPPRLPVGGQTSTPDHCPDVHIYAVQSPILRLAKGHPSIPEKSTKTFVLFNLRLSPRSCHSPEAAAKTANLTFLVNKNWHGGNPAWHQSGRGLISGTTPPLAI